MNTTIDDLKIKAWDSLAEWVYDVGTTCNKERELDDYKEFVYSFRGAADLIEQFNVLKRSDK